jgi:hypothetical protein
MSQEGRDRGLGGGFLLSWALSRKRQKANREGVLPVRPLPLLWGRLIVGRAPLRAERLLGKNRCAGLFWVPGPHPSPSSSPRASRPLLTAQEGLPPSRRPLLTHKRAKLYLRKYAPRSHATKPLLDGKNRHFRGPGGWGVWPAPRGWGGVSQPPGLPPFCRPGRVFWPVGIA